MTSLSHQKALGWCLPLVVLLCLEGIVVAGDVRKGAQAFQAGDYKTALEESQEAADNGNAEAQFLLGLLYGNDYDPIPQSEVEAARWFRLAANQHHSRAQHELTVMFAEGRGVPQDYVEAYRWAKLADHPNFNYIDDRLVKHPNFTNIDDLENRITKSMTPAQVAEGEKLLREWLYFKKIPDYESHPDESQLTRYNWRPAAEQGDPKAQTILAVIYAQGEHVKRVHTEEAIGLLHKAAMQSHAHAKFILGHLFAIGQGVKRDYSEAVKWYQAAADQGHIHAQLKLGAMYAIGQGVPKNFEQTRKWYEQAAEKASCHTQFIVGQKYATGDEAPVDHTAALRWLRRSAEKGYPAAQHALGDLYANGNGLPVNYAEAMKWYRLSAEQGFAPSVYTLGMSYFEGRGVEKDNVKAYQYVALAWGLGDMRTGKPSATAREKLIKLLSPAQIAEGDTMMLDLSRTLKMNTTCPSFFEPMR